jgi:Raf kinase inhibitor-like YbhB/YbcL family protein
MEFSLRSSAFAPDGAIPAKHTCEGGDVSPPLAWSGVPAKAKSLALIVDDPDAPDPAAPRMTWVHWVLYNIPTDSDGLAEGVAREMLPRGTLEGINDWKRPGYGGPCPQIGRHRYFHKLFALDCLLPVLHPANKAALEAAMAGHVLAHCEIVGTYQRKK